MTDRLTARQLAKVLHEHHLLLLKRIVRTLGEQRTTELLIQTLLLEQQGGLSTREGSRRTVGGIFLHLCRAQTTTTERLAIFGRRDKRAVGRNEKGAGPVCRSHPLS